MAHDSMNAKYLLKSDVGNLVCRAAAMVSCKVGLLVEIAPGLPYERKPLRLPPKDQFSGIGEN